VFDENKRLMIQPLREVPERLLKQNDGSFAMRSFPAAPYFICDAERACDDDEAGFSRISVSRSAHTKRRCEDVSCVNEVKAAADLFYPCKKISVVGSIHFQQLP
jgi:hypothetical protein